MDRSKMLLVEDMLVGSLDWRMFLLLLKLEMMILIKF